MMHGRRPRLVLLLLLFAGGGILVYSAWFYSWSAQLKDFLPQEEQEEEQEEYPFPQDYANLAAPPTSLCNSSNQEQRPATPVSWALRQTHEALLAAHRTYTQTKLLPSATELCANTTRLPAASMPRGGLDQTHSLSWLFAKEVSPTIVSDGLQVLTCDHFDPACTRWTDQALDELYNLTYVPPNFVPSAEAVRPHYAANNAINAAVNGQDSEVMLQRKVPDNTGLAQVGVLLDGFVTSQGSIITRDFFIPSSISEEHLNRDADKAGFPSTYQYLECNRDTIPQLVEVRAVAVIYHLHQDMFYHMVQDQYYRLLALLPHLQQNPDIYIFLSGTSEGWEGSFGDHFLQFCNISKSQVIFSQGRDDVGVKADVIYYVQELSRHETSAMGFAQQLRSRLWNLLDLPNHHRPWSSLLDPAKRCVVEAFFGVPALTSPLGYTADHPLEVNIVAIVRTNPWRGRLIINYEAMKAALLDLAARFPAKLLAERAKAWNKSKSGNKQTREWYVKVNYREHLATTSLREAMELFAQADIVIGPHGAGFVFLAATRPGAHVVEFVGGYEQNMMTTARLGSAYHGIVANLTKEGIPEGANSLNYKVDIPQLMQIVTSALAERFVR